MGSGYQIDVGEMKSLTHTLEHAEEAMSSANNALNEASPQDLGSAGLDSAGADFQDKWEYGIGKIADLAGEMTGGLQDTLKTYQEAEDNVSKVFPDPGEGGPPMGRPPAGNGVGAAVDSAISNRLAGGAST